MSRLQLALNVPDLDDAVAFYSKLFRTEPAKRKPGYANFAIADPPLKLVLFEKAGADNRLNHLGIEVFSADEVADAQARLTGEGVAAVEEIWPRRGRRSAPRPGWLWILLQVESTGRIRGVPRFRSPI